jgi:hypothetical protein
VVCPCEHPLTIAPLPWKTAPTSSGSGLDITANTTDSLAVSNRSATLKRVPDPMIGQVGIRRFEDDQSNVAWLDAKRTPVRGCRKGKLLHDKRARPKPHRKPTP